jgi:hypothetical protein
MKLTFNGSVHFANGIPAPEVEVNIYDRDASRKEDDDLTVTPGFSDDKGHFSLIYEPLRYLDYHTIIKSGTPDLPGDAQSEEHGLRVPDLGDLYLPYLRFNYTFNGHNYTHTCSMGVFTSRFYLPENPPIDFLPSTSGFKFENCFSGYFLPFSTPAFIGSPKVSAKYGLCGGMCAAAYDYVLAGRPIPDRLEVPRQGTRLHRYLFQRQMDSLGGMGQEVIKVAQWTSLPEDTSVGTMRRTADEFQSIRQKLDYKNPVVLALIYVYASSLRELSKVIFNNHQVLAYAYQQDASGSYTVNIYDPNLPGHDDVILRVEPAVVGEESTPSGSQVIMGLKTSELVKDAQYREIRGFFAMPYTPVTPPKGI